MQRPPSSAKDKSSVHSGSSIESRKTVKKAVKARKLFRKRNELKIMLDNYDVTPSLLTTIASYNRPGDKSVTHTNVKSGAAEAVFGSVTSTAALQSHLQSINMSYATQMGSFSSIIRTRDTDTDELLDAGSLFKESEEEILKPDTVSIKPEIIMPTKATITLNETSVMYLFELPSITAEKDTEEGNKIEKDNERYEYLTVGKGKNRKTTNAEVQTVATLFKSRYTLAERCKKKNNHAFASGWDMYDTYENRAPMFEYDDTGPKQLDPSDPEYIKHISVYEKQLKELMRKPSFQNSVIIMERILANNVFNFEQKRFRGLIEQDPFRPDIEFKYRLELLWTFKNESTEGHPVTSMHWNPSNKDILAVGYGKFTYNEQKNGFVYCWNIKNPIQPEREYYYKDPVTAVAFSTFDPNLIAVGLYNGVVNVLDISSKDVVLVYKTSSSWSPSHEPVWQVTWLPPDDYHPDEEYLVCVTEEGRICRLSVSKTDELSSFPLMRVIPIEGKVKGVYQPRHCPVSDVPISRSPAALLIAKHLADKNIYYIGTDEGAIHKCSRNYLNQHIEMFLAHNGPVYTCEFSPFCNKLFLTCGADWCTNIWAENENITEPLITLSTTMEAIEGSCWSPANSTIIANIAGSDIYLWDIQRRTYLPASVHKSPTNCRNTKIQFTDSGRNLIVADIEGNVHIFALEDMPFPPFYQAEMLTQVIRKTLITRKDLISKLDNMESLNY